MSQPVSQEVYAPPLLLEPSTGKLNDPYRKPNTEVSYHTEILVPKHYYSQVAVL